MKNKTLVKTKIVLSQDGEGLVTYFWKKVFWIFGYWYPFGCCSGRISKSHVSKINDNNVSKVLYDEFITGF